MTPFEIAARLAALLSSNRWYHRTTLCEESDAQGLWHRWLRVWGTGARPRGVPVRYEGLLIEWCRVTPQHPCPFGSVRETPGDAHRDSKNRKNRGG
jgi:hypothetical protein